MALLALTFPRPAPAAPPAAASGAEPDFLPAQAALLPAPPDVLTPNQPVWDMLPAYAAIHGALQDSLAGLTASRADIYTADLETDYAQAASGGPEIGKRETEQRLRAFLDGYQYTSAVFGITGLRMIAPDTATAIVRLSLGSLSRNTPPTLVKGANGKTFLLNNTISRNDSLLVSQDWVQRGGVWRMRRARTLKALGFAVL